MVDKFFKVGSSAKPKDEKPSKELPDFFGKTKSPPTTKSKAESSFFAPSKPKITAETDDDFLTEAEVLRFSPEEIEQRENYVFQYLKHFTRYGAKYIPRREFYDNRPTLIANLLNGDVRLRRTENLKLYAEQAKRFGAIGDYIWQTASQSQRDKINALYRSSLTEHSAFYDAEIKRLDTHKLKYRSTDWISDKASKLNDRAIEKIKAESRIEEAKAKRIADKEEATQKRLRARQVKIDEADRKRAEKAQVKKDKAYIRNMETRIAKAKKIEASSTRGSLFYGSASMQQDLDNFKAHGSTTRPLKFNRHKVGRILEIYSDIHSGNIYQIFNHTIEDFQ